MMLLLAQLAAADSTLRVESDPPGAWVKMEGESLGTTPVNLDFPPAYFRGPMLPTDKFLREEAWITVGKPGYETKKVKVSEGPHQYRPTSGGVGSLIVIPYFTMTTYVKVELDKVDHAGAVAPKPTPKPSVSKPAPAPKPAPKAQVPGFPTTFVIKEGLDVQGVDVTCPLAEYHERMDAAPEVVFPNVPDEECRVSLFGNRPVMTVIRGGQTRVCAWNEDQLKGVCTLQ